MNRPTVLILTRAPAFSREITANWPHDPVLHATGPEFIVLDEALCCGLEGGDYDLAIVDACSAEKKVKKKSNERKFLDQRLNQDLLNQSLQQAPTAPGKPAIVIHSNPASDLYNIHGPVIVLRREPGLWPAMAGLLGHEILRRYQAPNHGPAKPAKSAPQPWPGLLSDAT